MSLRLVHHIQTQSTPVAGTGDNQLWKSLAWIGSVGGYDTSGFNEAVILNNNVHCTHSACAIIAIKCIKKAPSVAYFPLAH